MPAAARAGERGFYMGADLAGLEVDAGREYGMLFGSPQGTDPRIVAEVRPETAAAHGLDVVWSAQLGYRFSRYFALELGYVDLGSLVVTETYDPPLFTQFPGNFESDVRFEAAGPSLSALAVIPLGNRFEAYARAGVLHADQAIERSLRAVLPGESGTEHVTDDVPVFGIGAAYAISADWSLRIEYQRIDDLHGSDEVDGISSVGPLRIQRVGLGVTYVF
jgi:OOP family OmpA-OmpF porin